eukprot:Clim_evm76s25 gene=Clim_evmTU76s25
MEKVIDFLREYGLEKYENLLEDNGFDSLTALREIKEEDLKEMKIVPGHRRLFLLGVTKMKEKEQATPSKTEDVSTQKTSSQARSAPVPTIAAGITQMKRKRGRPSVVPAPQTKGSPRLIQPKLVSGNKVRIPVAGHFFSAASGSTPATPGTPSSAATSPMDLMGDRARIMPHPGNARSPLLQPPYPPYGWPMMAPAASTGGPNSPRPSGTIPLAPQTQSSAASERKSSISEGSVDRKPKVYGFYSHGPNGRTRTAEVPDDDGVVNDNKSSSHPQADEGTDEKGSRKRRRGYVFMDSTAEVVAKYDRPVNGSTVTRS